MAVLEVDSSESGEADEPLAEPVPGLRRAGAG